MNEINKKVSRTEKFVAYIFTRCEKDKGAAARLRRAGNPDTEYQSWEFLAQWVDLERPNERLPHALIASRIASVASAETHQNGHLSLGQAIARCYEKGCENDSAKAKLRRLLSCNDVSEVCRVLRPLLSLIDSRVIETLDYARFLDQLLDYHFADKREFVRAQWAQDFYRTAPVSEQEAV